MSNHAGKEILVESDLRWISNHTGKATIARKATMLEKLPCLNSYPA